MQGQLLLSFQVPWVRGVSWFPGEAELGSRARSCPGGSVVLREEHERRESQGGSTQARVSTLEGSCGLAAGRRHTAVAAV